MRAYRHAVLLLAVCTWPCAVLAEGSCPGVKCSIVQSACYGAADLEPITCGLYYGCCYKKTDDLPVGDNDCRNSPCGPGCPNDVCISSGQLQQGLTVGEAPPSTRSSVALASAGILTVELAVQADSSVSYTWWNLGQASRSWQSLSGDVQATLAPAASLVGTYLFAAVRGGDGQLYLNQGSVNKASTGWQRMSFRSSTSPALTSSGRTTAIVARGTDGRVAYNSWDLGQGQGAWRDITMSTLTSGPAAAALIGSYLFVVARGADGQLYLNQGGLNRKFVGWRRMNLQTRMPASAASSGNVTVVAALDSAGNVVYTWWRLGEGARAWTVIAGSPPTDAAPTVSLVGDYAFVAVIGRDGRVHLNQGTLGQSFVGWR